MGHKICLNVTSPIPIYSHMKKTDIGGKCGESYYTLYYNPLLYDACVVDLEEILGICILSMSILI